MIEARLSLGDRWNDNLQLMPALPRHSPIGSTLRRALRWCGSTLVASLGSLTLRSYAYSPCTILLREVSARWAVTMRI